MNWMQKVSGWVRRKMFDPQWKVQGGGGFGSLDKYHRIETPTTENLIDAALDIAGACISLVANQAANVCINLHRESAQPERRTLSRKAWKRFRRKAVSADQVSRHDFLDLWEHPNH